MKTLTEFSTLTLRKAAEARAAYRQTAPAPAVEAPAAAAEAPAEGAAEGAAEGDAEAAPAPAADPAAEAVAAALGVPSDRAARLLEALDIVGGNLDQVRLVRVFQGETGPHGAVARGEFHYVIDRVAGAKRGGGGRDERRGDRGDRGGDRGGRGGGGDRPRGGDRDKPRGLSSLMHGAPKEEKKDDDRPARGEMPRAGIGWQLTAAPRGP